MKKILAIFLALLILSTLLLISCANGKDSIDYGYITNTFEKVFTEKFKGITMISDIKDCFVPGTQIKDSAWHLTREGAVTRTQVVINDLKEALGK